MTSFTPREIVSELDRYIIGQKDAKRAVAIALRNRWRRLQLDNDDAVRWFWYSVLGRFPEPPRIHHDPAAAERARKAQAAIEARKARNFTVTKDEAGAVVLTLDDGTVAKLPTA